MTTPNNKPGGALNTALHAFCTQHLRLRELNADYKNRCEAATAERNRTSAQLVKIMNEDDVDVLELRSGGFLCRKVTRTQASLTEDMMKDVCEVVLGEFPALVKQHGRAGVAEVLRERLYEEIRAARGTMTTSVVLKDNMPRLASGVDVGWADAHVANTAALWAQSRDFLAEARREHTEKTKSVAQERERLLDTNGVRQFMEAECKEGKPITMPGHASKFTLKYQLSERKNPVREKHIKDGVESAVDTLLSTRTVPEPDAFALVVLAQIRQQAGVTTSGLYTLSARPGRKRASDGSEK